MSKKHSKVLHSYEETIPYEDNFYEALDMLHKKQTNLSKSSNNDLISVIENETKFNVAKKKSNCTKSIFGDNVDTSAKIPKKVLLAETITKDREHLIDVGFKKVFKDQINKDYTKNSSPPHTKSTDYDIYIQLLSKYNLKCCKEIIYVYVPKEGRYKELSDNELKILIRSNWMPEIEKLLDKRMVDNIIDRLKSSNQIQIDPEDFDKEINLLNLGDCVINLITGEVLNHSEEYMFTSFINVNYKTCKSNGKIFKHFIQKITDGNQDKEMLLKCIIGYLLSNYYNAKRHFSL